MEQVQDFVLGDFTPEMRTSLVPSDGGNFQRIPFGDYRMRIIEAKQQTKEGERPHVMIKVTFKVIDGVKDGIGLEVSELYGGSAESPRLMKNKMEALLQALGVSTIPRRSSFIGREVNATIVWELSKEQIDPTTGEGRRFVNERVKYVRSTNAARPDKVNPESESRQAASYLEEKGWWSPSSSDGDTAPWGSSTGELPSLLHSGFKPESQADESVFTYRAHVKVGGPLAEQARAALVNEGFDPDGPIDANRVDESIRAAFLKVAAGTTTTTLPPLVGMGEMRNNGGRPRTGTRAPR